MNREPIQIIDLKNGLKLELFDRSRPVAGDRYRVAFKARIELDVTAAAAPRLEGVEFKDIVRALGEKVEYVYRKERNFIAGREKGAVFEALKNDFLETSLEYLSSPDFASKLIRRKYAQTQTYTPSYLKV